jgi:molecular chaperone GrpE
MAHDENHASEPESTFDSANLNESEEQVGAAQDRVEDDMSGLLDKVQSLTTERDQLKDQVLRLMADFQTFKRRNQHDILNIRQTATENFVRDLLPVLDNFERSLSHLTAGAAVETIVEGVKAVERQLRQALESQNVTRINSVGTPFDPNVHEALGTEESEEHPEETVTTEIEAGYRMGEKVIRPARVRVAKKSA